MVEDHSKLSLKSILHIHAIPGEYSKTVKHYYTIPIRKLTKERRFSFEFDAKKILRRRLIPRKFPRTAREHTEFEKRSCETTCPNCLNYINTKIYHYSTGATHAIAASLFPVCMCLVPYCTDKYKNTAHYCPRCKIFLGTKFGERRTVLTSCVATSQCER